MKRKSTWIFAALAVVLAAAVAVSAGDDKLAKMKAEFNLTDAQVQEISAGWEKMQPMYEKIKAAKTELKALKTAASPDQKAIDAKQAQLDTVVKAWKEKNTALFRSVMTTEQYAKFEAKNAEAQKQHAAQNK